MTTTARMIPGTHTPSSGLREAEERRRAWEERPRPWWDADGHIRDQHATWGRPLNDDQDD